MLTQLPKAGERQIHGKCSTRAECVGLIPFRHDFPQQPLLGAEVVQKPRRRHAHPIGQCGDAGSPIALGGKQVHGCVDDLLSAKISSRLGIAFVGTSRSSKMSASARPERCSPARPSDELGSELFESDSGNAVKVPS